MPPRGPSDAEVARWKSDYEGDMTIEDISLEYDWSTNTVRKYLHLVGVQMRPPGDSKRGTKPRNQANAAQASDGSSGLRYAAPRHALSGHRRRARL